MSAIKNVLRTAQSYAPWMRPLKFNAYNWATRNFGARVPAEIAVLGRLGPVDLALDIGANWGQSIFGLQYFLMPKRIVSFEPNPVLAKRLQSQFASYEDIDIRPYALGREAGEFTLYTPRYRNFIYDGLASLDQREAAHWLNADRMAWFDPAQLHVDRHAVMVHRLDDLGLSPDVIKIDVQGCEEDVIAGGSETLQRSRPALVIEWPGDRLIETLRQWGYRGYHCEGAEIRDGWRGNDDAMLLTDAQREALEPAAANDVPAGVFAEA